VIVVLGRFKVLGRTGWYCGRRLLCLSLNGFLCLDWASVLTGHSAGGALPRACCGSW